MEICRMARSRFRVALPLLDELRRVNREAANRYPHPYLDPGLGAVGLILDKTLDESRYEGFTPEKCQAFARTGGEGVHFGLVGRDGLIDDDSPVIICIPQLAGQCYILGENLFDFLCLGKDWGYFRLEQLGYDLEATLDLYTSQTRKDADTPSDSDRDEKHQQAILNYLSGRLGLRAWGDAQRFHSLQDRYAPCLE
jgi:hypothetical protein